MAKHLPFHRTETGSAPRKTREWRYVVLCCVLFVEGSGRQISLKIKINMGVEYRTWTGLDFRSWGVRRFGRDGYRMNLAWLALGGNGPWRFGRYGVKSPLLLSQARDARYLCIYLTLFIILARRGSIFKQFELCVIFLLNLR